MEISQILLLKGKNASDWIKPKEKPYFHQISMDCLEKLVECIERFNKGEIDADTYFEMEKHNRECSSNIE